MGFSLFFCLLFILILQSTDPLVPKRGDTVQQGVRNRFSRFKAFASTTGRSTSARTTLISVTTAIVVRNAQQPTILATTRTAPPALPTSTWGPATTWLQTQFPNGTIPYHAGRVVDCWNCGYCLWLYSTLTLCWLNYGPITNPNNKSQSVLLQNCFCGQQGYPAYVNCAYCLGAAGVGGQVDSPLLLATNEAMAGFCYSDDPNAFLWLYGFVNFTQDCAPLSADWATMDRFSTAPLAGDITSISSLAPLLTPDLLANSIGSTVTPMSTFWNTSAIPNNYITGFGVVDTVFLTSIGSGFNSYSFEGIHTPSRGPEVVVYMTTVPILTSATISYKDTSVVILGADGTKVSVYPVTASFGETNTHNYSSSISETLTVFSAHQTTPTTSEGAERHGGTVLSAAAAVAFGVSIFLL
ncbi:hypothetical protein NA57DRAFT_54859 [Rhizodiscina lignyota]|uniref:Uncharacterized protein n=1 Tax=Rhizodiscina lignyota TaxID=1504668 RepID=A0A9P4IIV5_9PEZI|nr:hypothetical protein NA57DRAFT_54859 [Rhizodiscina lignyota]